MGSFSNPHISKYSMMPKWHQLVPVSVDVDKSKTVKKIATIHDFKVYLFVNSTRYFDTIAEKQKKEFKNFSLEN